MPAWGMEWNQEEWNQAEEMEAMDGRTATGIQIAMAYPHTAIPSTMDHSVPKYLNTAQSAKGVPIP